MAAASIHDLYSQYIRGLPLREQLRLAALILEELADHEQGGERQPSVLDLYGAGAHNPVGMDAQDYVNTMREEWDHRP
jgi:hypothetical protein